ncbi:MAG: rhomboid family intramembrane serine protease [Candidatus Syntrophonatronum acetioxidans]|uniref:Rhomboid family intramembrane serine protease n=1 Tax=Candidatus Syntrophonatronum acetioxidans TaxID=1795816 RepID=A0A424YDC1_9FIRM|nr:MAG: rhomboid family intramembrane serine protease [Candidatus Syntrophonatronum acetioxidans]
MIDKVKKGIEGSNATLAIILINIIVYIALITVPNIADILLLDPDKILEKPWTLVTVFFSHEWLIHIFLNMGFFFIFSRQLEKLTSSTTVLIVYLTCGFIGSLTFMPFAPLIGWSGPVVGASAAVWGVAAAFAAMRPDFLILKGKAKHWIAALFVGNTVLLVLNPQIMIGAAAHYAGIVVGLICGYWLKIREQKRSLT